MARQSGRSRTLGGTFGVSATRTNTAGTVSFPGTSTHRIHSVNTGLTSFQCVLGYQPSLFPWDGQPSEVPAMDFWFRESERVWDSAHVQLQLAVRRQRTQADAHRLSAPPYQPGDKVWLSTRDICFRLPCRKLSPRFIGPFTIKKQINWVFYQLALPPTYCITPTFHVSLLKPHTDPLSPSSPGPDESEVPPPPEIENEESIYRVNTILDSQR